MSRIQAIDPQQATDKAEKLLATKQGSAIQTQTIDGLRKIAFGDIRLAIRIGYGTFNSDYPK